jgi:DNA polymerase-3 subunit beta
MKLTAAAAAIGSALSLAAAARQRDALVTIIAGEGITVACSDLGITIKATVAGDVIESGATAVSAKRLAALIAGFAADAVINIKAEPNGVTIGRYRLASADIPIANTLTGETGRIEIDGDACVALLNVSSAAATDTTRLSLNGIFLHTVGSQLVAVAANGIKLLRHGIEAERFSMSRDLIVPTRSAVALAGLIRHTKSDKVLLRRSKAMLAANGNGFEFTTRLIDAIYPAFEAMIPEMTANTVTVDRVELLAALARLTAIANGERPLIALTWTEGEPLHVFLPRQPDDGADDISAETKGRARTVLVLVQLTAMLGEFSDKFLHLSATDRLLITDENKIGVLMGCAWSFQDEAAAA